MDSFSNLSAQLSVERNFLLEYFSLRNFAVLIKRFMNFHQTLRKGKRISTRSTMKLEVRMGSWHVLEYSNTFVWNFIGYVFRSLTCLWCSMAIIAVSMHPSWIYDLNKSLGYPSIAPKENTRTSFTFLLLIIRHENQKKGKETYNLNYFFSFK